MNKTHFEALCREKWIALINISFRWHFFLHNSALSGQTACCYCSTWPAIWWIMTEIYAGNNRSYVIRSIGSRLVNIDLFRWQSYRIKLFKIELDWENDVFPMSHLITEMAHTSLSIRTLSNTLSFHTMNAFVIFTVLHVWNTLERFIGRYFDGLFV